ncbi:GGDEF domain-containing protein [Marinibactrum halimedae]|nr:GGDEF domain-containing protein [Marinibactrum halimedae]MCD9457554.1 GGDEF domain-containing protein [Marinibactrum halimedae]
MKTQTDCQCVSETAVSKATGCKNIAELTALKATVEQLKSELEALKLQSRKDGLTGLYNHQYFREALHREIERTERAGQDTCLIMLDLDHFKQVNDTYGHEGGNHALQHTTQVLTSQIRPIDIACRYGGEEFAILLPATPINVGKQVAERVRKALSSTPLHYQEQTITLTASFGVSVYHKRGFNSIEHTEAMADNTDIETSLIEEADQQLYRAKAAGRNTVCTSTPIDTPSHHVTSDEKDLFSTLFQSSET